MKNEAELRALLEDIELLNEEHFLAGDGPGISDAFLNGVAVGLNEALDNENERCGNPSCDENHTDRRIQALAAMRSRAAGIRAARAAERLQ